MHPPFIFTDHRIGPDPVAPKPKVRRTQPARLDLRPAAPGWPPMPLLEPSALAKMAAERPPVIYAVPAPRRIWRDILGRFLIRMGQRLIVKNASG